MKSFWMVGLVAGLFACGGGNSGNNGNEGERRVEDLGRQVSGSRLLSEYYQYSTPCNYISASSIETMFELKEGIPITWVETDHTCELSINNKKVVSLSTTSTRPFESVFHAEYYFDRLYQPEDLKNRGRKLPYTGPEPEGTGAEAPPEGVGKELTGSTAAVAGAPTDSTQAHAEPGALSTSQLDDNTEMKNSRPSYMGVGEKAVWDAKNRTLHILDLQHVFHITVNYGPTAAADSLHAIHLGNLLISQVDDQANQGERTIY